MIVDDTAPEPGPGQMRKGEFLAALRSELEATLSQAGPLVGDAAREQVAEALRGYEGQSSASLEQSIRHSLSGAAAARDARSYIALAGAAVRRRIAEQTSGAVPGAVGETLGAAAATGAGLVQDVVNLGSAVAGALLKGRDGGQSPHDPVVVRGQLGAGRALDDSVRSGFESAYGRGFSDVRVHSDSAGAELSGRLDARAFTVGRDIAFAAGEYQPGTVVGDALIAHELAHVAQQEGAAHDGTSAPGTAPGLEEDADRSAVGAVTSLWGRALGWATEVPQTALPRLRSGLRLQRCVGSGVQQPTVQRPATCAPITPEQWRAAVTAARAAPAGQRAAAMTQLAQQAVCDLGITVRMAGSSHPTEVHPEDYQEIPVLNFDVLLNNKTRKREHENAPPGPPVGSNPGYNFNAGSRRFAVIGPNALNEDTPLTTRQYAQHELYLTALPPARGQAATDQEVQAWTEDFRNYFHQYLALPIPQRPSWQPLIGYYEAASPQPRQRALQRLTAYYDNPPVPADQADRVRRAFRSWMRRRSGTLIDHLSTALGSR